jgi:uncharacterized protein (TIGR00730 family)
MTNKEPTAVDRPVIAVFGSHAPAPGSQDYETARHLGRLLAEAGFGVATGGYSGTMSGASQGAAEAGGLVIGVTSSQVESSRATRLNRWVERHVPFESLQDRLLYLVRHNDGIVVLPGGIGTLSEFALAWSYMQVGEMTIRPLVLLGEIWAETLAAFVREEYGASNFLHLLHKTNSVEDAVDYIRNFKPAARQPAI